MASESGKYSGWIITTVAGNGSMGFSGDGGPAIEASLNNPFDVIFDSSGNLIFTDTFSHCIRHVDKASGAIRTIAGTTEKGYSGDGGPAVAARFSEPYGMAMDGEGALYVADRLNAVVRRIDGSGIVTTFAGSGGKGYSGDGGPADKAGLVEPNGLAFSRDFARLYIADVSDNRVRAVDMKAGSSGRSPVPARRLMTATAGRRSRPAYSAPARSACGPETARSMCWNARAVPSGSSIRHPA